MDPALIAAIAGRRRRFDPLSLGGKLYRADSLSASPVVTWPDRGALARTLTAIGSPVWTAGAQNGQPAVTTGGGAIVRAAAAADWPELSDGSGVTLFAVLRPTVSALQWIAGTLAGGAATKGGSLLNVASGNLRWVGGTGAATIWDIQTAGGQFALSTWHVVIAKYRTGLGATSAVLRIDRVQVGTSGESVSPVAGAPAGPFTLGGRSDSTANSFDGAILECDVLPLYTSAAQDAQLEAYSLVRYGV